MSNLRLAYVLAVLSACAADAMEPPVPDAAPVVLEPAGRYAVTSSYVLAAVPPEAADVLGELVAATDGPDDPSRYLIDLMVARLPEGHTRTIAAAVAPYIAAYVNERIVSVAPRFVEGVRSLVAGLSRAAHRFGTVETIEVGPTSVAPDGPAPVGLARRVIVGYRFDSSEVPFDPLGLPDVAATVRAMLLDDRLSFDVHSLSLRYGTLLRLALDRAVIPEVVPARDLAHALHELVDCPRLGALVADYLGIGSPDLYAGACSVGLTRLASAIYARIDALDAVPVALEVTGAAVVRDLDDDGGVDALEGGAWQGTFAGMPLARGLFDGARR